MKRCIGSLIGLKPEETERYIALHANPFPGVLRRISRSHIRNYAIFLDLPVVFDIEMALTGTMPFRWDPAYGARIGLLHRGRAREGAQPIWFDIPLCYVFHIMNAWDDGAPGRPVDALRRGWHYTMGDTDRALAKLAQATSAAPDSFAAWHALAEINFSLRRFNDALGAAERAHALRPDDLFINTTLSRIWVERGDKARAEHFGGQAKIGGWREQLKNRAG